MKHLFVSLPLALSAYSTVLLALSATAAAQTPGLTDVITEKRVKEVVTWLAHDDRRGRDTPSPELTAAGEWLAERFRKAGLSGVPEGKWFHEYTLPGRRLDSTEIKLTLDRKFRDDEQKFELVPNDDVRIYRGSDVLAGDLEPATVAKGDDRVLRQMLRANSGRRPVVIEVSTDHPYWRESAGKRSVLGGRRRASRPVFLVREGILPPREGGGDEAGWAATWATPTSERTDILLRNIVAVLPGTSKREEYIVVSAHYDHVGVGRAVGGDTIYNGADDNATGTTAVVLLAEALAKMPAPQRSILFVCFSAEEKGLRGSKAFCDRPPVPREQIVANVNIEMIGRPPEGKPKHAWITGVEYSDFGDVAEAAFARGGIELMEFGMARMLFRASDNYSFVRHGIVAHSISAGSLHEDYHKPGDEVAKLDLPHMTQVIVGLAELVRELADRDAAPQWNEAGKKMLSRVRK
ncbi:MAG: M28 family peptidase [bacterium]|nr:M28 family peptidase [bacterium]